MATTLIKQSLDVLSKKINASYSSSVSALRTTLERAIECGGLLNEAKSQLKHGDWLSWLEEKCPAINRQTAAGWMRLSKSNVQPGIHLGVKEAQKLLSGPSAKPNKKKTYDKSSDATGEIPKNRNPLPAEEHPLPISEREAGDEPPEPEHAAPESESTAKPNKKLDFDDNLIEGLFGKLIKAIDLRADVFKQKNSAYHKTCINRLDAFITAFNEWKATRR